MREDLESTRVWALREVEREKVGIEEKCVALEIESADC